MADQDPTPAPLEAPDAAPESDADKPAADAPADFNGILMQTGGQHDPAPPQTEPDEPAAAPAPKADPPAEDPEPANVTPIKGKKAAKDEEPKAEKAAPKPKAKPVKVQEAPAEVEQPAAQPWYRALRDIYVVGVTGPITIRAGARFQSDEVEFNPAAMVEISEDEANAPLYRATSAGAVPMDDEMLVADEEG